MQGRTVAESTQRVLRWPTVLRIYFVRFGYLQRGVKRHDLVHAPVVGFDCSALGHVPAALQSTVYDLVSVVNHKGNYIDTGMCVVDITLGLSLHLKYVPVDLVRFCRALHDPCQTGSVGQSCQMV